MSGPGTNRLLPVLAALRIPATGIGAEAGTAAGLKLLRSVFMKGLAATIFESVTAAEEVGAKDWIVEQVASELGPDGGVLVRRMLEGTLVHAVRREAEMREARSFLDTLGVPHPMTDGTIEWLQLLSQPSG